MWEKELIFNNFNEQYLLEKRIRNLHIYYFYLLLKEYFVLKHLWKKSLSYNNNTYCKLSSEQ